MNDDFEKEQHYTYELIRSLYDDSFNDFYYLYNVKEIVKCDSPSEMVKFLLELFEDLVNTNTYGDFTQASVNRIISQFVNVNSLARSIEYDSIFQFKALLSQLIKYSKTLDEFGIKLHGPDGEFLKGDICRELLSSYYNPVEVEGGEGDYVGVLKKLLSSYMNVIDSNKGHNPSIFEMLELTSELAKSYSLARGLSYQGRSRLRGLVEKLSDEELNRNYIPTAGFSQEGEDLILKRLFPPGMKGFYVDVGAHHPTRFSNTYLLYQNGWRGITIDPLPGVNDIFKKMRPRDTHLQVAVGAGGSGFPQTAEYIRFQEAAYNCILVGGDDQPNLQASEIIDRIQVPLKSLDSILEGNNVASGRIDLLSVDVEGYEEEVLSGFSIEKYLPQVVVIEIRGFRLELCGDYPLYKRLTALGYHLKSMLYNSLIFTIET